MQISAQVTINGSKNAVWKVISDIHNAANVISAIELIEILEKPQHGLLGLKWRETRTMFGKSATEEMEITEVVENEFYKTHAESHGSIYKSTHRLTENGGVTTLTMEFSGKPVTFVAKAMMVLMGWMFKGATRKAVQKDLEDIKLAVEASS